MGGVAIRMHLLLDRLEAGKEIPQGSPKKRQKKSLVPVSNHDEQVSKLENLFASESKTKVSVVACLLDVAEIKSVTAAKRVVQCTLGDESGIVSLGIWSPIGEKIHQELQQKYEDSELTFAKFDIAGLELVVCQMRPYCVIKLQSTKLTQFRFVERVKLEVRPAKVCPRIQVVRRVSSEIGG